MENVSVKGDYFGMNRENVNANNLTVVGNYSFDGAKNIEIKNARMLSKDSFWNSENVMVYDRFISGEYLGWNSENLTLINCTIESLQGMCYIGGLKMVNCKLLNTTLAFEYSTVDVDVVTKIDSIKNPISGVIRSRGIGEIIIEDDMVDAAKTSIITLTD